MGFQGMPSGIRCCDNRVSGEEGLHNQMEMRAEELKAAESSLLQR